MKTLIIGMFSLALLTSVSAWGAPPKEPSYPPGVGPINPNVAGICNSMGGSGVLIIVVNTNSEVRAKLCPGVTQKPSLPDPTMSAVSIGNLGTLAKYKKPNDPDPCVWWNIGGSSYVFCW